MVRNLSYKTNPEELRTLFAPHGQIIDVYMPKKFGSAEYRGFGFIEFGQRSDAEAAIKALDSHELEGRQLSVDFAKDKRKSSDQMRNRDGDPRRGGGGRGGGGGYGGGGGFRGGPPQRGRGGGGNYCAARQ